MNFEVKKIESCFAQSANFQYRIECSGASFKDAVDDWAQIRVNEKLRRPTFIGAFENGTQVKGVLTNNTIRVGFPESAWEDQKAIFEERLKAMVSPAE